MKKIFLIIATFIIVIVAVFVEKYQEAVSIQNDSSKFNKEYEFYNKEYILGTDITTLINMATDNNEKYEIKKDENNLYIQDEKYCIKIYVELNDEIYPMEAFNEVGLKSFTQYFGAMKFKCSQFEYHDKTKRVSKIVYKSIE